MENDRSELQAMPRMRISLCPSIERQPDLVASLDVNRDWPVKCAACRLRMPTYAAMHERGRWHALAVMLEGAGADLAGAAGPVSRFIRQLPARGDT
jgi:hypothetical protein